MPKLDLLPSRGGEPDSVQRDGSPWGAFVGACGRRVQPEYLSRVGATST